MTDQSPPLKNTQKDILVLRIYFSLVIIGGFLTLGALLRIPAEGKSAVLFGLSSGRLVLVGAVLLVIFGAGGMLLTSWLQKSWFLTFTLGISRSIWQRKTWGWWILFCTIGLFGGSYLIMLTPEIVEPFTLAIFERLLPLLIWFTAICAQTLIALPILRYGANWRGLMPKTRVTYQIATIFGILLILWLFVAQTGLGITASDVGAGWNFLGAPVLETQVFLAWVIGMIFIGLAIWREGHPDLLQRVRNFKFLQIDLLVCLFLWLTAFIIWNSIPLTPNWYAAPPRIPNQAIYPNSDAYLYDTTAQSLLVGEGLKTQNAPFAIRPLYALFLAGLHAVSSSSDYEPIIWMQVAVLGLIPILLFWITRQLHNRISGLIAALLLILREGNAIILGGSITTSHSKLLMADLPTTFGVMLFVLLIIQWLQRPAQRQTLTLIAGGVTGAFMLIRPEFGVILPFVGLVALFQLIREPKVWFKGMMLIAAGTILMLFPWVWRNYQITNTIFLDSPHYRADLFALRYQEYETESSTTSPAPQTTSIPSPEITITPQIAYQPGESGQEFAERMTSDAAQFAKDNPGQVLFFIINHFFNSQVQSVLYLPGTIRLIDSSIGFLGHKDPGQFWHECCSTENYIRRLPFWFRWDGHLPQQSVIPLFINLLFISVGLAYAWKKQKFIGLIPIAVSVGYTLVNAVVRNSGGRYILPVDWVGILYYAIGIGQLSIGVIAYFRGTQLPQSLTGEVQAKTKSGDPSLWRAANLWTAAAILLLGCVLPLSEKIVPERYPQELLENRQVEISSSFEQPTLKEFVQNGAQVIQGRALYPRYHPANQGEAGIRRTPFSPLPFARIDFYIVGPFNGGVVLAQTNPPENFPNGSDVLVIGCRSEKNFEAVALAIYDDSGKVEQILLSEPYPKYLVCPFNLTDQVE